MDNGDGSTANYVPFEGKTHFHWRQRRSRSTLLPFEEIFSPSSPVGRYIVNDAATWDPNTPFRLRASKCFLRPSKCAPLLHFCSFYAEFLFGVFFPVVYSFTQRDHVLLFHSLIRRCPFKFSTVLQMAVSISSSFCSDSLGMTIAVLRCLSISCGQHEQSVMPARCIVHLRLPRQPSLESYVLPAFPSPALPLICGRPPGRSRFIVQGD